MNRIRTGVALAAAGALVLSGVADAAVAPKPICKIVSDASGDAAPTVKDLIFPIDLSPAPVPPIQAPAGFPNVPIGSSIDALDVLSADIAADKKKVTVVIRVKKLSATAPTSSPTGMRWKFFWKADDFVLSMGAHTDPTGAVSYDAAYVDPTLGGQLYGSGVTGTFDTVHNEIHLTAPTDLFAAQATIKPGRKLSELNVVTGLELAVPDKTGKFGGGALLREYPASADTAATSKAYVVGAKSCVTPGK